ncbi:MAG: hypothetical protein QOK35_2148, partial [Pseudonocardiales bacterium]|nr:hypothetical protein [Pseudonocardiales bacterium]
MPVRVGDGVQMTWARGRVATSAGDIFFLIVALAPVLAVLAVPIQVLDDAGLHLASADALQYTLTGEFADVLTWRPGLPPNLTVELIFLGLLQLLSPIWALKVVVAGLLGGFAYAARRLVVAAGAPGPWAVLLLPFAWHHLVALGFLGFSAAVVLALLAVAVALEHPTRPPVARLATILTLTWLTHLIPALVAVGVCGAVVVVAVVARREDGETRPAQALRNMVLAALPTVVLTAAFVASTPSGGYVAQNGGLLRRLVGVVGMVRAGAGIVPAEVAIYGLVALVLYAATAVILLVRVRERSGVRAVDALLVSALIGDLAALVVPQGVSGAGWWLETRIALFPPLLLAAWVAAHLGGREAWRGRRPAVAVAAVLGGVALLLVVVRLPAQLDYSAQAAETLALAPCLPEHSTLVELDLTDPGDLGATRSFPLSNQVGVLAAERRSLDVRNESGWVPYYLWRYRDGQSADRMLATQLNGIGNYPPRVDLAGALQRG